MAAEAPVAAASVFQDGKEQKTPNLYFRNIGSWNPLKARKTMTNH